MCTLPKETLLLFIRVEKNEIEYTLVLVYSSNGHHVEKVFPLSDKFKPGTWFTLAVRVIGDSDVEVIFDCKLFERVKLFQPMDALPRYLEGRLAHSLQRDMFTLRWTSHERFIVSAVSWFAYKHFFVRNILIKKL